MYIYIYIYYWLYRTFFSSYCTESFWKEKEGKNTVRFGVGGNEVQTRKLAPFISIHNRAIELSLSLSLSNSGENDFFPLCVTVVHYY